MRLDQEEGMLGKIGGRGADGLLERGILPMTNVVFLLLLFFLVLGRLDTIEIEDLILPRASQIQPSEDELNHVLVKANGDVVLNGELIEGSTLGPRIGRLEKSQTRSVRVSADAGADSEALIDVYNALRIAGVERILLSAVAGS
jgi:biopolymer transport protein ExbD